MRVCGACRNPLRYDESLSQRDLGAAPGREAGGYACCPRCVAGADGVEPPPPRVYPEGEAAPVKICGLCRTSLYEGERARPVRLHAGCEADGIEPGAGYVMCPRCIERHPEGEVL
jgi:hypothetical protein